MEITLAIISALATIASAGWISTYIEKRSMKKQLDAEGDQARIGNLQSVCDRQEAEISRLNGRLLESEERYKKLEDQYYQVLERQHGLIERVASLEEKLAKYEATIKTH